MGDFEGTCFASNVRLLAKEQGKRLGDLEDSARVSHGYFSRVGKSITTSKIPLGVVVTLARELGVSIDTLVESDLAALPADEVNIITFLDELSEDTRSGVLKWDKFESVSLPALLPVGPGGTTNLPLFSWTKDRLLYHSAFDPDTECFPSGDCFAVDIIKGKTRLFLFRVKYPNAEGFDYELYTYQNIAVSVPDYMPEPICGTNPRIEASVDKALQTFYTTVQNSSRGIKLSSEASSVIQTYRAQRGNTDKLSKA